MSARVLIVDGNDAARAAVAGLLGDVACEVDQAPDGVEAFESLLALPYDLVVAEATLARLDTPDLIAKLRGHGVKTPVLILTAVTKAATLGVLMKAGIAEYVSRALPPDAIRGKLLAHLPAAAIAAPAPEPGSTAAAPVGDAVARRAAPVSGSALLVDAVEVEHQRLRALLPAAVALDACKTFNDGLGRARTGRYGMLLLDTDGAVLNLSALVVQTRKLQPEAAIVAIVTLGKYDERNAVTTSLEGLGFDEVVFKPFAPEVVALLAERYCTSWDDLVTIQDDVVEVSRLRYRRADRDRYRTELATRIEAALRAQSDACFDHVVLDLTCAEQLAPNDAAELIARVDGAGRALGITLFVAVAPGLAADLRGFEESFRGTQFRWFASTAEARAAAAG